ncbi:hypothetical protein [Streptomyces murinus]|uniref:hypothetical protein n=1 Tax=Streptomyces murinus TaxID=33900 RepID=UPI002E150C30|nr:hypothetical protein OG516_19465 [Streptomyces murinus]
MVNRPGLIAPEIAQRYGVSIHTVTKTWPQHPSWPGSAGKRGRYNEYDAAAIANFVQKHVDRKVPALEPKRLYTAQQLEDAGVGIKAGTIRADLARGRWPEPDNTDHGVNRWFGATAETALTNRRRYRR